MKNLSLVHKKKIGDALRGRIINPHIPTKNCLICSSQFRAEKTHLYEQRFCKSCTMSDRAKEIRSGEARERAFKKWESYIPKPKNTYKSTYNSKYQIKWRTENKEQFRLLKRLRRVRQKGAPGRHTLIEWETLKKQVNYQCACCFKVEPNIKLTEDHIIPISKGGSNSITNIQPLCLSCNSKKHTKETNYMLIGGSLNL